MHRSSCVALGLLLATACEGGAVRPEMSISFSSAALLEEADVVAVYFFDAAMACGTVQMTIPRPPSIHGPFAIDLDAGSRDAGLVTRIDDIAVGAYTVFVDAVASGGRIVGSGCAGGQQVFEGQVSQIQIVVSAP